ncbi:MAG: hypothetical protein C4308_02785 [Chitinophagaceae bacterium]
MPADKKHIGFLCSRLDLPGGIERAIVNLSNLFIQKQHKVSLVILDETDKIFYPLSSQVNIFHQQLSFGITKQGNVITRKIKLLSDVLKLKKLLKKIRPEFIIATEYPFVAAAKLSGIPKAVKLVSWEHHHFYELEKNFFWERLFQLTYPKLSAIVTLNEDEKNFAQKFNPNCFVIPNFIEATETSSLDKQKVILTIGRLTNVKGIDRLLPVVKAILEKHSDWKWKLIGDGELKTVVEDFTLKNNLGNRFILQPPFNHQIKNEYQQAAMYVMTSRNECLPMTLMEAMSCSTPCIAFDCPTGPRHIITNGENGLLIKNGDVEEMTNAVSLLIENEGLRKKMGEKAFENIQRFSPENIYKLWEQLF